MRLFGIGLLVGAISGAAAAVFLAPKTGEETRRVVWGKAHEIAGKWRGDGSGEEVAGCR